MEWSEIFKKEFIKDYMKNLSSFLKEEKKILKKRMEQRSTNLLK